MRTADGDAFRFRAGRPSLDLCSTLLWRLANPVELLAVPADLDRWLAEAGLLAPRTAASVAQLAEALRLREAVYRLAVATVARSPPAPDDRAELNAIAARAPLVHGLGRDGTLTRSGDVGAALATVARDAVAILGGSERERLKMCDAPECAFLFVDTSRAGRRRWCASNRCGNRENVRAHRRRTATDGEPG